ncbi:hypothetical protein EUTSA_v100076241mg [Eutrema salsugineum]|uniref:RRM domain-containing protein n=1 Tax=Eutrema salsugineum TaxID=72664 RepID=V4KTN6_EUTSA|nr:hypothetical protein EUTSA_v100076241mg [Eutrema salsugineum]
MRLNTLSNIDDENLNGGSGSVEVTSIISRDCQDGVVLVVVCGYSTQKETLEMMKNFTQVFFLAPQEPEGYFVLIDILQFDDQTIVSASNNDLGLMGIESVVEERVPEMEVTRKEVAEVPETQVTRNEVVEVPKTEVPLKEVGGGLLAVSEPNDGLEDVSKISDASADVKLIQEGQHPSCDPNEDTGNGNNQESQVLIEGVTVHVGNLPPNDTAAEASPVMIDGRKVPVAKARGQHPSSDPSPEKKAGTGNGNNHEDQAVTEDAGICVKNLPPDATIASVQKEFEQFGAIRRDGIRVINRLAYSFAFIDFEEENAARIAMEASPIIVLGRRFFVQKNRRAHRSYWNSQSSGQGNMHIRQEMRGTEVYHIRKDWQKSNEEQSKRQDEERGTGIDHSRNYEQAVEEHGKIQGEQMKLQEEAAASPVEIDGRLVPVEKARGPVQKASLAYDC